MESFKHRAFKSVWQQFANQWSLKGHRLLAAFARLIVLCFVWNCWVACEVVAQQQPFEIQFGNQNSGVRNAAAPGAQLQNAVPTLVPQNATAPNTPAETTIPVVPTAPPTAAPPVVPPQPTPLEQTSRAIAARLQQVQEDGEKKPEIKEPLLKQYQSALADLKAIAETQKQRAQWLARIAAAPRVLEEAKARRSKTATRATLSDSLDYMSFDEVQKELQGLQAELATTTELRVKLSEQIVTREKRRKELPQLMSDARAKLDGLGEGTSPAAAIEDPLLKEAVEWSASAARMLAAEQLQALEAEQRAYEAEAEAIPLQLELAQVNEKQQQEQVRKVTEELNRMRQDRILQLRDEVRALVSELPEDLKPASDDLLKRISDWLELAEKRSAVKAELDSSKNTFDRWKDRFDKMKNRVDPHDGGDVVAGFNSWIGLMLRKQRSELPDPVRLNSQIRQYQQELQSAESMLFDLEDALIEANANLESVSAASVALSDRPRTEQLLLEKSKEVITSVQVDVDGYLNDVLQVADIKEQTRGLSQKYAAFIDEHVLWIRSSERMQRSEVGPLVEAFRWLVDSQNWNAVVQGLVADAVSQPWWYALFSIAWLVMLFNQARLRRVLGELSELAGKKNCVVFRYTAEAAVVTFLIALPVPILFLFFNWRLRGLDELNGDFAKSFANGLLLASAVFFPLELMRQTSRLGGLGSKHFEWTEKGARILRTNLRWLIDFSLPIVIVIAIFSSHNNARWESSLGRVAFILLMVLLAIFFGRVFMPRSGILARYLIAFPNGWFERLRYGWYSAIVLIPVSLAALSFIGYHYTAQRLASHLNTTLWLVVCLTLLFFLLRRWLLLGRRKLMISQAKQRLAEVARRDPNQPLLPVPEEPEINIVVINEQTMRLVSSFIVVSALVAIFMIWSDVMPAIVLLENFELWTVKGDLPDEMIKITLANLVFLIPIVALMLIAGRNVPGLLEIALLQHLPITSAARYAITTLSRYLIFVMGIIFVSNTIGLRWSSIQWLVAAFGVGLGFGLQEIFANFVSGLILLFEQPIRVGDVITLDGVTGSVARIRMRATTIVNWDRQELIIPNKDLITGKLLNWTLSDTTNRIVIHVGVAYGSDTEKACALITAICKSHPNVLTEPAPIVSFDKFDESSLRLTLRAFLASLDVRLQTLHELNTEIHREFNAEGIVIAFPQRDLNIRSVSPQISDWFGKS